MPQVIQEEITTFFMDSPNNIDSSAFYLLDEEHQKITKFKRIKNVEIEKFF